MSLQIECTHCCALVSPKQVDLTAMQVACDHCGQKTPFAENTSFPVRRKPHLSPPPGILLEKTKDLLKIQVLWQNTMIKSNTDQRSTNQQFAFLGITGLLFTSIFIIPSVFVYALAFPAFLFAFYHFIYRPFSLHQNQIQIRVTPQYLEIDDGQWPHFLAYGKNKIPTRDLQQLYIRRSKKKRTGEKNQRFYALCAVLKNRESSPLIEPLISPQIALFLEQEIEYFLKIKDEAVVDEIA